MKFKEWLDESIELVTIFLDFDNCLIDQDNGYCVRPHAHEFINEVQTLAPTYILTFGYTEPQQEIAEYLEINLPLIGRDRYSNIKYNGQPILVDNLPATEFNTKAKLKALNATADDLILIDSWYCDEPDNELPRILSEIKQRIAKIKNSSK